MDLKRKLIPARLTAKKVKIMTAKEQNVWDNFCLKTRHSRVHTDARQALYRAADGPHLGRQDCKLTLWSRMTAADKEVER